MCVDLSDYNRYLNQITGCEVAPALLTKTGQLNGRWQILTSYRIATPEPTTTKFGTIDYVSERTPKPNLIQIHPLGPSGEMGEI